MIIYGKNTVLEALKNKKKIIKIYVTSNNIELIKKYTSNKSIEVEVLQFNTAFISHFNSFTNNHITGIL